MEIKIVDNFLPSKLADLVEKRITETISWDYLPNIADGNPKTFYPGFIKELYINAKGNQKIDEGNVFFYSQILYYFCFSNKILLEDIYRLRLNLNLPILNTNLSDIIHTDLKKPHLVLIYYVNDSDGDTVLFDNDTLKEVKRVSPKKGRALLFDGSTKHAGSYPTKNARFLININFKGQSYE